MLTKHIKDVCSAVRNQYRRAVSTFTWVSIADLLIYHSLKKILNGIDKQSSVSLSNFTYDMAGKFRREGVTVKIDMKEEFRCSMLVRHSGAILLFYIPNICDIISESSDVII
jgi:hypothetical protein